MQRLKELVQMEAGSWQRHRVWIAGVQAEGRGGTNAVSDATAGII
jgi:hypothetical protein